jgi:hypothetical protein
MTDISQLSNDELQALQQGQGNAAAGGAAAPQMSAMSDDDLHRLYAQQQATAPDTFGNLTNTAARYATFGLSDLAGAAGSAVGDVLSGAPGSFGENYNKALARARGEASQFSTEHPYSNALAALAGAGSAGAPSVGREALGAAASSVPLLPNAVTAPAGVTTRPFLGASTPTTTAAAPTLAGRVGTGMLGGAGAGAASGYSNTGTLQGTVMGAGTGAVIGGAAPVMGELASVPINAFTRRFLGGADSQALDRIAGRVAQDERAGGPGVAGIQTALAGANGKPLSIADVGGENTQALAGNVTRMPGEGREVSTGFLGDRSAGAASRMTSDLDTALPAGSAFTTAQDLMQQRATAARPLYDQAYAANASIASPEINAVLDTPAGKNALAAARVKMLNDQSTLGQPIPGDLSLRTLDYVKRSLDDQIGGAIHGGANDDARILTGLKKQLVGVMDDADATATRDAQGNITTPGLYQQARDAFAGPSALNDALQAGQTFRSMRPEQVQATMDGYSPSEREFFRLGAADSLRKQVMQTGDPRVVIGTNSANNRGADMMKQQLRPLFDNQGDFDKFIGDMSNESMMQANTGKFIGNSATAARVAEDNSGHTGTSALANAATIGGALLGGEPFVAASRVPALFSALRNVGGANNPAVNASMARVLFTADPATNAQTLAQILAQSRYPSMSNQLALPVAAAAGSNPVVPLRIGGTLAHLISGATSAEQPAAPR